VIYLDEQSKTILWVVTRTIAPRSESYTKELLLHGAKMWNFRPQTLVISSDCKPGIPNRDYTKKSLKYYFFDY